MRLRSAVCETEVVVVRAGEPDVDIRCGGHPMVPVPGGDVPEGLELTESSGTLLGKRYGHESTGLELLCTKPGVGGLSVGSELLTVAGAKPLPSSD
jgi:hypothetical protein